ncbi:hypothetical protein FQN57_007464 [Myotisia sp. PD_48]|nr:hypothetical protein FQN57_007464 [Myotisia sp. PD_48]
MEDSQNAPEDPSTYETSKMGSTAPRTDTQAVTKRLQSELMQLMMSPSPGISAFPDADGNLLSWTATICGPDDTPYQKLALKLSFTFPTNYPYSPPTVLFKTPIYHPNVDFSGRICLDILKEKWSAVYNVQSVLLSLQSLLGEPNNSSPLNGQAATLWDTDPNEYQRLVLARHRDLEDGLEEIQNFGPNPTGVRMHIYAPQGLINAPVLVAIHPCTGSAKGYYAGTKYAQLADLHGFIVIYPHAPNPGGCWDVHTPETLQQDAGGDSLAIASMVRYVLKNYKTDPDNVYMTGMSSGGMMVNVLAGAYPQLFAAGCSISGVPYGCFSGPWLWNSACSTGNVRQTAQDWGNFARAGYEGYKGKRPRLQLWHGTRDGLVDYQNLVEAVKQWSNVLGSPFAKNYTNMPQDRYTKMVFGEDTAFEDEQSLVVYSADGVEHPVPEQEEIALSFFGLI